MGKWDKYIVKESPQKIDKWSKYKVTENKPFIKDEFLPGLEKTERKISKRELPIEQIKSGLFPKNTKQGMIEEKAKQIFPPLRGADALKVLSGISRSGESAIATPLLEIQKGTEPGKAAGITLNKALTGKSATELGDIIRTTGWGGKLNEPLSRATGLLGLTGLINNLSAGNVNKNINELPSKLPSISKLRNYPANKVLEIRKGARAYHKEEVTAYGNMLDNLSKESGNIDASNIISKMNDMMIRRGLYDPAKQKWVQPLDKVGSQLVKSYENIVRKYQTNNGKIPINEIIDEYKLIRDSGGKFTEPTNIGRIAGNTADEFFSAIKPQIKNEEFLKGNARYSEFKNNMESINKYFNIWESNPTLTEKGEKFLSSGAGKSKEARDIIKITEQKTGQSLRGAKTLSGLKSITKPIQRYLPWIGLSLLGGSAVRKLGANRQ